MRVLVAGVNVRHIACSASRAGHEVIAADGFCDLDLQSCASEVIQLRRPGWEGELPVYVKRFHPKVVVLGPGLEEARLDGVPVLNNPPERAACVSDKLWLARWLEDMGFPFIRTEESLDGLQYPVVAKPRRGAGGVGCRVIGGGADVGSRDGLIFQELVAGRSVSVSVICNGRRAAALAVNEQLLGEPWAGASGFRYVGNITPLEAAPEGIERLAEEIVSELGLIGSNGVDMILTETGPAVVEVNPRFQGSLETIEMATGMNVFQSHLEAFSGDLPCPPSFQRVAGRAIIYASRNLLIGNGLRQRWTRDVPRPGSVIGLGEPVLSVVAEGMDRESVYGLLRKRAAEVRMILTGRSHQETTL